MGSLWMGKTLRAMSSCATQGRVFLCVLSLGVMLITQGVFASNLGVEGSVYSIAEPDMLRGIERKLVAMKESGALEREQKAVIRRSVEHILRPKAVSGVTDLPKGRSPQSRYFDPSIVLSYDIKNKAGELIALKGARVNPLEHMRFKEQLVFINGDSSEQLRWANQLARHAELSKGKMASERSQLKIILIRGNIKTSSDGLKHRVYFDQHGSLCRHFHITHTPTKIWQPVDAKRLLIQEVSID